MAVRVSLTKAQQEGIGAELLLLCQSVTADGKLTESEIRELIAWLNANQGSDLPAIGFLTKLLRRIVADGVITADERRELHIALEKVLPPEFRQTAKAARREVEIEEDARQRPLQGANFMVAGVHYDGRGETIERYVNEGDPVYLVREPTNAFSRNAIRIYLANRHEIGFVPEDYAFELAPVMDGGARPDAFITKVLRGGRVPIPVVQAYLYRPDATLPNRAKPVATAPPRTASAGPVLPTIQTESVTARRRSGVLARIARMLGF